MKLTRMFATAFHLSALINPSAFAVVNLDQPVQAGVSNKAYRSAVDPKLVYVIPLAVKTTHVGKPYALSAREVGVQFMAEVPQDDLTAVRAELDKSGHADLTIQLFRPLEFKIEPSSQIPEKYRPELRLLGDFALQGQIPYALLLKGMRERAARNYLEQFFTQNLAHIATIEYEFNAILEGAPQRGKSRLPVFVHRPAPKVKNTVQPQRGSSWPTFASLLEPSESFVSNFQSFTEDAPSEVAPGELKILKDAETPCWETVQVGEVCLRADPK